MTDRELLLHFLQWLNSQVVVAIANPWDFDDMVNDFLMTQGVY